LGGSFLQDAYAVLAEPRQRASIIVGLYGHVLDAVVLLMVLRWDEIGDVEL